MHLGLMNTGIRTKVAFETVVHDITHLGKKKISIPLKKSKYVFITGDADSCNEVKLLLAGQAGTIITENKDRADETLLCEGTYFSVGNLLELMEKEAGKKYRIHMLGTQSITGNE